MEQQQHQHGIAQKGEPEALHHGRVMIPNLPATSFVAHTRWNTMIQADDVRQLAVEALQQLKVGATVRATGVRELSFGAYMVSFGDVSPLTRFPVFEIGVQEDWSLEQAGRELRLELRKKLWICP